MQDDVVVWLHQGEGQPVQADLRSKSRLGKGDMGKNADRIMAFLKKLREATAEPTASKPT